VSEIADGWEPAIGLEVHVQLATRSKLFCSCPAIFGAPPNTAVCPVCLGLPGALPVVNRTAVTFALRFAVAVGAEVAATSEFARKSYFYPDLPKGYQISQYEQPLARGGTVTFRNNGTRHTVRLERVHLEEDAGKSIHAEEWTSGAETYLDFNRCGVPLLEIVTAPDIPSPEAAAVCVAGLRQLVRYLEISTGNLEEGSLRCDANISLRRAGEETLGTKTEIKNLNSLRSLRRALEYEVQRQSSVLDGGGEVTQRTLLWDERCERTRPTRTKEEAHDYRYFPEPDLPRLEINQRWLEEIGSGLPELPEAKLERFRDQHGLCLARALELTEDAETADFFESTVARGAAPKEAAKWIAGHLLAVAGENKLPLRSLSLGPEELAELLAMIASGQLSTTAAKAVLEELISAGGKPAQVARQKNLLQLSDEKALLPLVRRVISDNAEAVASIRQGRREAVGHLMGELMRSSGGRANPRLARKLLEQEIGF
jgi:aspartyl-tRNA(Asn)/glutamyl-tRNA(Gln) amidotransferase subunit B